MISKVEAKEEVTAPTLELKEKETPLDNKENKEIKDNKDNKE